MPQRRCIICGQPGPKGQFVRVVRSPAGGIQVDAGPKVAGRGAYICRSRQCLTKAADGKRIARALQGPLAPEEAARLQQLARDVPPAEPEGGR